MKETPVELVRVAPAVAEAGLLPLGYPNPAALHVLPTAPTLLIPRMMSSAWTWSTPTVPWPDLRVPVLCCHSGIVSKPYCRACQKEHRDFFFQ